PPRPPTTPTSCGRSSSNHADARPCSTSSPTASPSRSTSTPAEPLRPLKLLGGIRVRTIDTVVIGAGQAGLAVSRCLTDRGRDHVVLDRGRIGEGWRSETWDSLHLLSPNWINTLPGEVYRGPDPDGFAAAADHVRHLDGYAASFGAPVEENTAVRRVTRTNGGFEIVTENGVWRAGSVVVATGWSDRPAVPGMARDLAADVHQVVPRDYRNP